MQHLFLLGFWSICRNLREDGLIKMQMFCLHGPWTPMEAHRRLTCLRSLWREGGGRFDLTDNPHREKRYTQSLD